MGSTPYPLSPLDSFLHLRIFNTYVQSLDLELTEISVFKESRVTWSTDAFTSHCIFPSSCAFRKRLTTSPVNLLKKSQCACESL
jgi:hypothetical protein